MDDTEGLRKRFTRLQLEAARTINDDVRLSTAARTVGQKLNNMVNFDRRYAWPNQATLVKDLGIPKRTLIRAIKQLIAHGHFLRWRTGRKNRYVPRWLERMGDGVSRAVLSAADPVPAPSRPVLSVACDAIGANVAPIGAEPGNRGVKGASVAPFPAPKGASVAPLESLPLESLGTEPVDGPSPAPVAAGGETAATGSDDQQRELPLVRNLPLNPEVTNPHAAENAAHDRLDQGFQDALGDRYGALLEWLASDLLKQGLAAEMANRGAGVALILQKWSTRGENKVGEASEPDFAPTDTAQPLKRTHGAA